MTFLDGIYQAYKVRRLDLTINTINALHESHHNICNNTKKL